MGYIVTVTTENEEQFCAAVKSRRAGLVYMDSGYFPEKEYDGLVNKAHAAGIRCGLRLPHIWRQRATDFFEGCASDVREAGFDIFLFRNMESLLWFWKEGLLGNGASGGSSGGSRYALDHSIYVWNSETIVMIMEMLGLAGISRMPEYIAWPLELSAKELAEIGRGNGRSGARTKGDIALAVAGRDEDCGGCLEGMIGDDKYASRSREAGTPGITNTGFGSQGAVDAGGSGGWKRSVEHQGIGRELTVYGRAPMMVSAQCVKKTVSGCDRRPTVLRLKDRTGAWLPVKNCCSFCCNTIYNSVPTAVYDMGAELERLAPDYVRYEFTTESGREVASVLGGALPTAYTRGHFRQGAR